MRKVLVFGVFDGLHEGHRALFGQAKQHGDHLIVSVAQDEVVKQLKGEFPRLTMDERIGLLNAEPLVDSAVPGDFALGTYSAIEEHRPEVVLLGYDQKALGEDLALTAKQRGWDLGIVIAEPYEPERYHNSILRKN